MVAITPMSQRGGPITVGVADEQRSALVFAAEAARLSGCDLQLVHAYTVPPAPPEFVGTAYGIDVGGTYRDAGRAVLESAAAMLVADHGDVVVHSVVKRGSAPRVLVATSEASRLLVLGADDCVPWYARLFESRVSRKLAESAVCPVVVVPDSWDPRHRTRGVTLLLDSETVAHGPLRFAFEQAALRGDQVRVVHFESAGGTEEGSVPWQDTVRLIESWSAQYPEVSTDVHVVAGVADVDTVEAFQSTGLLVLGRAHGAHSVVPFHGSLARAVIEHADCPVAVVPPGYDC